MKYAKTEKQAIQLAKNMIRNEFEICRLINYILRYKTCDCACGESLAIELVSFIADNVYYTNIGICKYCA